MSGLIGGLCNLFRGLGRIELCHTLRFQRRRPAFTAIVVVTLALGIGVNTAIFSVANRVVFQPLPYPEPNRLVLLLERPPVGLVPVAYPNFVDWRKSNRVFKELAAYRPSELTWLGPAAAEQTAGKFVSDNFFRTLGTAPVMGRDFTPADDQPGAAPVAIISDSFWRLRLGADLKVIGKVLPLNGRQYTVAGVLPAGFLFQGETEVYLPLGPKAYADKRYDHNATSVIARMRQGVTLSQARANMDALALQLERQYPKDNKDERIVTIPLSEWVAGQARRTALIALGAVGFVLLIACANVASLMLAQSAGREREIALRTALGAGRGRIVKQLLSESALLALEGGALGLLLARWSMRVLVPFLPADLAAGGVHLDARVLSFAFLLSCVTGLLCGLAPALRASRTQLSEALKEGGRTSSGGRGRDWFRSALVVSEVALALVLLAGAGLMVRSALRLQGVDPGFRSDHVLTCRVGFPEAKILAQAKAEGGPMIPAITKVLGRYQRPLVERLQTMPGVEAAATVFPLPVSGATSATHYIAEGSTEEIQVFYHVISPEYFKVMRIPLRRGRFLTLQDDFGAARVAVISESMARRFWPGEDPIGRRFRSKYEFDGGTWFTVAGVVGDVRQLGPHQPAPLQVYFNFLQRGQSMMLALRASGDPAALVSSLRAQVAEWDREAPIFDVRTMDDRLGNSTAYRRRVTLLLGGFAALALALTVVGIYSVMSYLVTRRTREIGIRLAVGATRGNVLGMVVGRAAGLAVAGVTIGLAGAMALTRVLSNLLYEIDPADPATLAAVSVALALVASLAAYLPARRAARIDPMAALRTD